MGVKHGCAFIAGGRSPQAKFFDKLLVFLPLEIIELNL
jgi:hypothetical protein